MFDLFVPGRLCLFGEHSDWAGGLRARDPSLPPGFCLVTGTDQGLHARVEPRPGRFDMTTVLPGRDEVSSFHAPADARALQAVASEGGPFSYVAGASAEYLDRYGGEGLAVRVHRQDLPVAKGLSSSAAACVLVVRAWAQVSGRELAAEEEMDLAHRGERRAGSECGRMDQVCALGQGPSFLTFDGDAMTVEPIEPRGHVPVLLVDLRGTKDTRRILDDLHACYGAGGGPVARGVREALGPRNRDLLGRARSAVEEGDARAVGELMSEAQAVFDRLVAPACPELAAPRLHEVLAAAAASGLSWGGKGVGSQGDGTAQVVARGVEERAELARRLEAELDVGCTPLDLGR